MKANMGKIDKVIRIFFAIVIVGLYFEDQISGIGAVLLLILAGIFVITSFISFCPLYLPFGISTRSENPEADPQSKKL